jgi:metallo-beta-lactamase family protein
VTRATFVGACGTVTGSSTLLELADRRLLVDCGLFQGGEELEERNRERFPFDAESIDGVVLTHAHLDHVGLLPKLVGAGFHGPIWCSRPTRALAALVLEDSGRLQEEDARYAARKRYSRHLEPSPLFTSADARAAIQMFEPLEFDADHELLPGIGVRLLRAGHLLGAASLVIAAADRAGTERRWCFSGDVGRWDVPILVDPQAPAAPVDAIVLESTYGDRGHPETDPVALLDEIIHRTFDRGGTVMLPAFALGRTQEVLYHLSELVDRGRLDPDVVYLDSPMAIRATDAYRGASSEFDDELRALIANGDSPLADDRFHRCRSAEESKALNGLRRPAVIVAGSGMATGGRIVHHLKQRLPDERSTVVFAGFQAAGTRGRALVDGAQTVSIHGRRVEVRAEIARLTGLSAHADRDELLRWCRALPEPPARVFLNHGEDPPRKALAAAIEELGWPRPGLPLTGTVVDW